MKIVFLDIDGVLNTSESYAAYHKAQTEDPDKNPLLKGRIHMLHRHVEHLFDKNNVSVLNSITEPTGAQIVVSSSWRRFYNGTDGGPDFKDLVELLGRVGVKARIIDRTPCHLSTKFSQRTSRGTEIQAWLDDNKTLGIEEYVILDDDDDMDHLRIRHIWTNPEAGLTIEDAQEALLILGGVKHVPTRHKGRVSGADGA